MANLKEASILGGVLKTLTADSSDYFEQAHALLLVLSDAFYAADQLVVKQIAGPDGDQLITNIDGLRGGIVAGALEGVQSLIALGLHVSEEERHRGK